MYQQCFPRLEVSTHASECCHAVQLEGRTVPCADAGQAADRLFVVLQVSAGYDAHWRDPLANLQFRTSTFHSLCSQLRALADELTGTQTHTCAAAAVSVMQIT